MTPGEPFCRLTTNKVFLKKTSVYVLVFTLKHCYWFYESHNGRALGRKVSKGDERKKLWVWDDGWGKAEGEEEDKEEEDEEEDEEDEEEEEEGDGGKQLSRSAPQGIGRGYKPIVPAGREQSSDIIEL